MSYTPIYMENDETLYIKNLDINGHDGRNIFTLSKSDIKKSLKPILSLGQEVKESIKEMAPDEVEITMQVSVAVDNNNFIFCLVNASAEAQLSIKYLWKKEEKNHN